MARLGEAQTDYIDIIGYMMRLEWSTEQTTRPIKLGTAEPWLDPKGTVGPVKAIKNALAKPNYYIPQRAKIVNSSQKHKTK